MDELRQYLTRLEGEQAELERRLEIKKIVIAEIRAEIKKLQEAAPVSLEEAGAAAIEKAATSARRLFGWTNGLLELVNEHEGELTVQEARDLLVKKGWPANQEPYARTVQVTLARLYRQGKIDRPRDGVYRRKSRGPRQTTLDQGGMAYKNEEAAP